MRNRWLHPLLALLFAFSGVGSCLMHQTEHSPSHNQMMFAAASVPMAGGLDALAEAAPSTALVGCGVCLLVLPLILRHRQHLGGWQSAGAPGSIRWRFAAPAPISGRPGKSVLVPLRM